MQFTREECLSSSAALKTVSSTLSRIFDEDFARVIGEARANYESAEADDLYSKYEVLKSKFPDFKESVDKAAAYLEQVANDYDAVRNSVSNAI